MANRITVAFEKGSTQNCKPWEWETRIAPSGAFHVNIGPVVTLIFDDPQEGIDAINALATTPPVDHRVPLYPSVEDTLFPLPTTGRKWFDDEPDHDFEPDYDGFDSRGDR